MMRMSLSMMLLRSLQEGKKRLGKDALARVVCFVESQRIGKGAFMDKTGKPDLYYTSFGWLLSYIIGIGSDERERAVYLERQSVSSIDLVHYAAYMRCVLLHRLMKEGELRFLMGSIRPVPVRDLFSFEGVPHTDFWSPYTRFLWLSLLEDTWNEEAESEQVLTALERYHVRSGGYTNLRGREIATTNATVAALSVIGQLKGFKQNADILFLRDSQDETGGFKAAEASPIPDLLSTATALFVMRCYGIRPNRSARDFIEAHWLDSGGFSATLCEDSSDVEYVFYGLLALGSL